MSVVSIRTTGGYTTTITQFTIECPFCHSMITPNYLCLDEQKLFASCPNENCKNHFVLSMDTWNRFVIVEPNTTPAIRTFSEIVNSLSSNFVTIYNQAFHAEQVGLNQICGVGYWKALEFLIKDYLISKESDAQKIDSVKNKFLSNCIQENVQNDNIKNVAKRAVWLGNDETHYTRIWADKDVNNLKQLIDLTVRWIENEIETELVLQEMSK